MKLSPYWIPIYYLTLVGFGVFLLWELCKLATVRSENEFMKWVGIVFFVALGILVAVAVVRTPIDLTLRP